MRAPRRRTGRRRGSPPRTRRPCRLNHRTPRIRMPGVCANTIAYGYRIRRPDIRCTLPMTGAPKRVRNQRPDGRVSVLAQPSRVRGRDAVVRRDTRAEHTGDRVRDRKATAGRQAHPWRPYRLPERLRHRHLLLHRERGHRHRRLRRGLPFLAAHPRHLGAIGPRRRSTCPRHLHDPARHDAWHYGVDFGDLSAKASCFIDAFHGSVPIDAMQHAAPRNVNAVSRHRNRMEVVEGKETSGSGDRNGSNSATAVKHADCMSPSCAACAMRVKIPLDMRHRPVARSFRNWHANCASNSQLRCFAAAFPHSR